MSKQFALFTGNEKPRTSEEMAKTGFMRAGTCLGISGQHSLEFWPTTIVAIVPCILMVLDQVELFLKGYGLVWFSMF